LGIESLKKTKVNILEKYQSTGTFTFKVGERLVSKCVDIPNEPGVYLIYAVKKNKKELVYIGASGKMNQDGSFKVQKLKKRIQNMQNSSTRRQTYFENKIKELSLDSIEVKWFVTYLNEHSDLPLNIEGTLLQMHFDKFRILPLWNNQA
jgi:excinuclease UvrABC nuclease subunit